MCGTPPPLGGEKGACPSGTGRWLFFYVPTSGRDYRADWLTALSGGDWLVALLGGYIVFSTPLLVFHAFSLFLAAASCPSVQLLFHNVGQCWSGHQLFDSPLLDKAREETKTAHKYAGCGSLDCLLQPAGLSSL